MCVREKSPSAFFIDTDILFYECQLAFILSINLARENAWLNLYDSISQNVSVPKDKKLLPK